jgi:hypothetical protein
MTRAWRLSLLLLPALLLAVAGSGGAEVKPLLARIKAVGPEGKGQAAAARAWRELSRCDPETLPDILAALDDANPVAANWLRAAVEAIADRSLSAKKDLPAGRLEAFVRDTRHAGAARRLAFDCLVRVDPTARKRLIPGMLDDPGAELRRDAVALVLAEADGLFDKKDQPAATAAYRKALAAARDRDQVERAAKRLKELGVAIDLTRHFGFLTRWLLLGPFDNTDGVGFQAAYAPEKGIDLSATCQGKKQQPLRWRDYRTDKPYGLVDLNVALGKHMGVTAYALAVVESPTRRAVQLRAGSNNAVKVFLNGKEVYRREEYHHGMRMDQHTCAGVLRAGRNEILVKICQNEETYEWSQSWSFQLRVCDDIGGPVPVKVVAAEKTRTERGEK